MSRVLYSKVVPTVKQQSRIVAKAPDGKSRKRNRVLKLTTRNHLFEYSKADPLKSINFSIDSLTLLWWDRAGDNFDVPGEDARIGVNLPQGLSVFPIKSCLFEELTQAGRYPIRVCFLAHSAWEFPEVTLNGKTLLTDQGKLTVLVSGNRNRSGAISPDNNAVHTRSCIVTFNPQRKVFRVPNLGPFHGVSLCLMG